MQPENLDLAIMTDIAYKQKLTTDLIASIPENWEILTTSETAESNDFAYKSIAFINKTTKQVVIANRGTVFQSFRTAICDLIDDFCLFWQQNPYKLDPAIRFMNQVQAELAKTEDPSKYNLTLTGHSLGASIAELQTIEATHLQKQNKGFKSVKCITFDSPGSKKLAEQYIKNKNLNVTLQDLDVTTYNAAPNAINIANEQLGKLYYLNSDPGEPQSKPSGYMSYLYALGSILISGVDYLSQNQKYSNFSDINKHKLKGIVNALKKLDEAPIEVDSWADKVNDPVIIAPNQINVQMCSAALSNAMSVAEDTEVDAMLIETYNIDSTKYDSCGEYDLVADIEEARSALSELEELGEEASLSIFDQPLPDSGRVSNITFNAAALNKSKLVAQVA